jgi:hypothetical protein
VGCGILAQPFSKPITDCRFCRLHGFVKPRARRQILAPPFLKPITDCRCRLIRRISDPPNPDVPFRMICHAVLYRNSRGELEGDHFNFALCIGKTQRGTFRNRSTFAEFKSYGL